MKCTHRHQNSGSRCQLTANHIGEAHSNSVRHWVDADGSYCYTDGLPRSAPSPASLVEHPAHYGGGDNPYEAIKVIDACGLNFFTGNAFKYIARAGKKPGAEAATDIKKAIFYLQWYCDHVLGEMREPTKAEAKDAPTPTTKPPLEPLDVICDYCGAATSAPYRPVCTQCGRSIWRLPTPVKSVCKYCECSPCASTCIVARPVL